MGTASSTDRRPALQWLYSFLTPHWRQIFLLAALSLLTTILVVIQPYITKLIIDRGLLGGDFQALWQFSGTLLTLGIITTLLSGYSRIRHTRLSGDVLFALREDVYSHLLKMSPEFYLRQRAGDITSRMDRDVSEIQRFAIDTLFSSVSAAIGLLGAVSMMLVLSWQLSLILLLLVPLEFFYLSRMRPKVEGKNRHMRERGADISAFFAEKIPATKFIQSAGGEQREIDHLSRLNGSFLRSLLSLQITEFWTSAIPTTLVSISRAAIFLIGGYWVIQGSFALGSLVAFTTYVGMAIGPVQSLLGLYLAWQRLRVSLDRVSFLRQQPIPAQHQNTNLMPDTVRGHIEIRSLSFAYSRQHTVFENVNLTIPAGSKVGVIGESGIGKSTLLDLLQGHLQPYSGSISIDGTRLATVNIASWRQRIAIAPQDPVIFRDTLLDNIRYCCPDAPVNDVRRVARAAGLGELIARLPSGVDTLISERGTVLSGGEKQRIGLARAMLQKPGLLILDEPTSAADIRMEEHIVRQIDRLFPDTTRIVVSHRQSCLRDADLILIIKANTIFPVASFEEAANA